MGDSGEKIIWGPFSIYSKKKNRILIKTLKLKPGYDCMTDESYWQKQLSTPWCGVSLQKERLTKNEFCEFYASKLFNI